MTTFTYEGSGSFSQLKLEHHGRTHIYTGATANMLMEAMRGFAANHIIKMQQGMNDEYPVEVTMGSVREFTADYATKLRKGER